MSKKILIFSDSRGQFVPRGVNPDVLYTHRLAKNPDYNCHLILCPMKWTTIADFIGLSSSLKLDDYEAVILHLGIVDWSPRPATSAVNDVYNSSASANARNFFSNTQNYNEKVINNKKDFFDDIFGESRMREYLSNPFDVFYEGSPTVNMYSVDAAARFLLPILDKIPNLIFVNSNKILVDWDGDFVRGRPRNICMANKYASAFQEYLGEYKCINLLQWSDVDIRLNTCDNMHLTERGNDFVYREIHERLTSR